MVLVTLKVAVMLVDKKGQHFSAKALGCDWQAGVPGSNAFRTVTIHEAWMIREDGVPESRGQLLQSGPIEASIAMDTVASTQEVG